MISQHTLDAAARVTAFAAARRILPVAPGPDIEREPLADADSYGVPPGTNPTDPGSAPPSTRLHPTDSSTGHHT